MKNKNTQEQIVQATLLFNLSTKQKCFQLLSFYSHSFHPWVSFCVWCFQTNIFRFTDKATQAAPTASVNLQRRTFEPHNQNKALSCYRWSPILPLMGAHDDGGGDLWWLSVSWTLVSSSVNVCEERDGYYWMRHLKPLFSNQFLYLAPNHK